jgi:excisionase family DNA binding protein
MGGVSLGELSPLLTVQQCAEWMAVSRPTIYRLVRDQGLPYIRVTRDMRFRLSDMLSDIEKWLDSRAVST